MRYIFICLMLFSTTLSAETQKTEQGIVQDTADVVSDGVKSVGGILPDSVQKATDKLANDIKTDTKNSLFLVKLSDLRVDYFPEGGAIQSINTVDKDTLLATIGVNLLPNTWNIDLAYTTRVGDSLIVQSDVKPEYDAVLAGSHVTMASAPETPISWIDFYMEPIMTDYGNVGFGYRSIEETISGIIYKNNNVTFLDVPNGGNSWTTGATDTLYTTLQKTSRIYFTYQIPTTKKWYNGLGITYAHETSNYLRLIDANTALLKPDTKRNILMVGINKRLEDLETGFSIKSLMIGSGNSKYSYYNYNTKQNESKSFNDDFKDLAVVYMFKKHNKKQYHFLINVFSRNETYGYKYTEVKFELGLRF